MKADIQILREFGLRIQQERKKLGISQEELAFRAGMHRTYIGMIERAERNITLSNIKKLADALQLNIKARLYTLVYQGFRIIPACSRRICYPSCPHHLPLRAMPVFGR